MKVCITGATGFFGAYLAKECASRGHEITILRRTNSSTVGLKGIRYREVIGDINDLWAVDRAIAGQDLVFHVAAVIGYWRKLNELQYAVNVLGTRNVVNASLKYRVRRLVHTSSVAAVGVPRNGKPMDESAAYNAGPLRLAYFDTKHGAEQEVLCGVKQGLDAVMLNPSVIFGLSPTQPNSSRIFEMTLRRQVPFVPPGGFNAVAVEDVLKGHFLALERGKTGERYILGGENLSYLEFFARVSSIAGVKPPRLRAPKVLFPMVQSLFAIADRIVDLQPPLTPELVRMTPLPFYFSSDKARGELGYQPQKLDETFRKLLEQF